MNREQNSLSLGVGSALIVRLLCGNVLGKKHTYISTFIIRDENEYPKICSMFNGKLCSDRSF